MSSDHQENATDIAVIGLGGRFPGAKDPEQFRDNLRGGHEAIRSLCDEELLQHGVDPAAIHAPRYVKAAAAVHGIEYFDHAFFGFTPRDAEIMDPQLRLLLECAWSTLEHAGCNPGTYPGAIGMFAGAAPNTYFQTNLLPNRELMRMMNAPLAPLAIYTASDALSTMVSFKLNLRGPSITVQTACSTSLVAVHLAVQSLLSGECDLALAGGVNLTLPQGQGYYCQEGMILSPDGHCRPFEASAAGTVFGDGLGLVLLKRLSDARIDGDCIHAVIKGSAVNNDGSQKAGFTAPSVGGQASAMAQAISVADISADSISYVEAHGTGTALGDPIEVEALTRAFRRSSKRNGHCGIGSVKSNIGHLDRAAGIASLIKTIHALEDRQIPPTLHFKRPNPKIDFANSPFRVVDVLTTWERGSTPRRAAVNSVGFGGTNACVVLEEAPKPELSSPSRPYQLLVLSARSDAALAVATNNLAGHFERHPDTNLADAASTLQSGRVEFDCRHVVICRDTTEAARLLKNPDDRRVISDVRPATTPSLVFMFPGQGSQYVGMGQGLYEHEPIFRSTVDRCADILRPELELDLRDILYPAVEQQPWAEEKLQEVRLAQPALFVVEYAMAQLWMSWGIRPAAMIGHSVGEYVAACVSGVFTLDDALRLVAVRARLVQEQPSGAMLAVRLPEDDIGPWLDDNLSVAAVNSPSLTVVSGLASEVTVLEEKLTNRRVAHRRVQTSHAFHSAMMNPVVAPFTDRLQSVPFGKPRVPFVSNVTGTWATPAETSLPAYWAAHLRGTVHFCQGIASAVGDQPRVFIEVGPGRTLGQMVRQNPAKRPDTVVLASLGPTCRGAEEIQSILEALGRVWTSGVAIDWQSFYANERRHRVPLPTYPFEKNRFWIDPVPTELSTAANRTIRSPSDAPGSTLNGRLKPPLPPVVVEGEGPETAGPTQDLPILGKLKTILQDLSGLAPTELHGSVTFLEMGLDSLFLAQFSRTLESEFGVSISFGQLADEVPTLHDLARHLEKELPPVVGGDDAPPNPAAAIALQSGAAASHVARLENSLRAVLHQLSGIPVSDLRESVTFLEMGLDSLFLAQFSAAIECDFGISVAFGQLAEDLSTLHKLARYLEAELPATSAPATSVDAELAQMRLQIHALTLEIEQLKQRGRPQPAVQTSVDTLAPPATTRDKIVTRDLTAGQREIWLASQLGENASRAYNELVLLHLHGELHLPALEAALQEVVDRHDSLRTTFSPDGTHEFIHATRQQQLTVVDLSGDAASDCERRIHEVVNRLGQTVFNLVDGPLMQAHLIRRNQQSHLLHLAFHHVVVDGWSTHVIATELGSLYSNRTGGSADTLNPAMPYRDYIDWYHRSDTAERRAADERFWLQAFADRPSAVDLPVPGRRPTLRSYRAGHVNMIVDRDSYERFKKVSARCNATLFHFLLATFHAWLHRITGQKEIVVGVPVAGQLAVNAKEFPDVHRLVGHCANLLPVRSRVAGDIRFQETVTALKREMIQARKHELFTYGELVGRLNLPRDSSRVPLVSVTFNLNDDPPMDWGGLDVEVEVPPLAGLFFDLEVNIWETAQGLRIACYYGADLVDAGTVESWLRQWRTLMDSAAAAPQSPLGGLAILDPVERNHLLVGRNQTAAEYPREQCIHQLFAIQAKQTPESPAVHFGEETLTYRELNARANQLARHLQKLGIGPGRLVGICLERSAAMVVGVLAILKTGSAYVPLDPAHPKGRIDFLLEDAGIAVLVTESRVLSILGAVSLPTVCLDLDRTSIQAASVEACDGGARPADVAYVIYTSGSTGKPKGVQIDHRALVNLLSSMQRQPGMHAHDVLLAVTTLSFDIAGLEVLLPLLSGASMVVAASDTVVDAVELIRTMEERGVTVMQATPTTWRMLLEAGWPGRPTLKILCGGEPLPGELARQLLPRCHELWNMYGPTETTIWSTCSRVTDPDDIHIGRPIDNTEVYVLDERSEPAPVGVSGELLIGGDGLARGYWNRPDLTAQKFIPHPFKPGARLYRTGDLARHRSDGNLDCLGRLDDQVKMRGFRIELGEIEAALTGHADIDQAVVVAVDNAAGGKQLVAYVVLRSKNPRGTEGIGDFLRNQLPAYMVPSAFVTLDQLPLTPNGKVDRKALPAPDDAVPTTAADFLAPRTPVEMLIAQTWSELLGAERVGLNDNFFERGGHSLLAMKAVAQIGARIRSKLPVRWLFECPTVERLAQRVEIGPAVDRAIEGPSLRGTGPGTPLFYFPNAGGYEVLPPAIKRHLHGDRRYSDSLQYRGVDGQAPPLDRIEAIAADLVPKIRAIHPTGPYCLAGFCFGGLVAYEVARQLTNAGEVVEAVVLWDSVPSIPKRRRPFSDALGLFYRHAVESSPSVRRRFFGHQLRTVRRTFRRMFLQSLGRKPVPLPAQREELSHAEREVIKASYRAMAHYRPKRFSGRVLLLRTERTEPENLLYESRRLDGWDGLLSGPMTVIDFVCQHLDLLQEPMINEAAEKTAAFLRNADDNRLTAGALDEPTLSLGRAPF